MSPTSDLKKLEQSTSQTLSVGEDGSAKGGRVERPLRPRRRMPKCFRPADAPRTVSRPVSGPANQTICLTHLLSLERTDAHANDQAHNRGCCRAMASRKECRGRGSRDRQKVFHKGPDKIERPLQTFD